MKETYDKDVDFIAGETVVGGPYHCKRCDHTYEIEADKVTNLPVCPRCRGQHWVAR